MDGTLQSEENSCDETATVLFPCVWAGLSGRAAECKKRHTADTQVLRTSCCLQSFVNLRLIGRQSSKD